MTGCTSWGGPPRGGPRTGRREVRTVGVVRPHGTGPWGESANHTTFYYCEGLTLREMGGALGLTDGSISQILRLAEVAAPVPLRGRPRPAGGKRGTFPRCSAPLVLVSSRFGRRSGAVVAQHARPPEVFETRVVVPQQNASGLRGAGGGCQPPKRGKEHGRHNRSRGHTGPARSWGPLRATRPSAGTPR
jgi:hypothetical protein